MTPTSARRALRRRADKQIAARIDCVTSEGNEELAHVPSIAKLIARFKHSEPTQRSVREPVEDLFWWNSEGPPSPGVKSPSPSFVRQENKSLQECDGDVVACSPKLQDKKLLPKPSSPKLLSPLDLKGPGWEQALQGCSPTRSVAPQESPPPCLVDAPLVPHSSTQGSLEIAQKPLNTPPKDICLQNGNASQASPLCTSKVDLIRRVLEGARNNSKPRTDEEVRFAEPAKTTLHKEECTSGVSGSMMPNSDCSTPISNEVETCVEESMSTGETIVMPCSSTSIEAVSNPNLGMEETAFWSNRKTTLAKSDSSPRDLSFPGSSNPQQQANAVSMNTANLHQPTAQLDPVEENSSQNQSSIARTVDSPSRKRIRILWDIENISVPRDVRAFPVASKLHALGIELGKELWPTENFKPSSCRMYCFHNPAKRLLPDSLRKDLVSAFVTLIDIGKDKAGFADVQITHEMELLAQEFDPSSVLVVLISSDTDFVPTIRTLSERGIRFACIRDYRQDQPHAKMSTAANMYRAHAWRVLDWADDVIAPVRASQRPFHPRRPKCETLEENATKSPRDRARSEPSKNAAPRRSANKHSKFDEDSSGSPLPQRSPPVSSKKLKDGRSHAKHPSPRALKTTSRRKHLKEANETSSSVSEEDSFRRPKVTENRERIVAELRSNLATRLRQVDAPKRQATTYCFQKVSKKTDSDIGMKDSSTQAKVRWVPSQEQIEMEARTRQQVLDLEMRIRQELQRIAALRHLNA